MFYQMAKTISTAVLATVRRWEVRGGIDLPAGTGAIVVANHVSYWDPVAISCAMDRNISFMAKADLFKIPLLGPFLTAVGTFPVSRDGNDRDAIRHSLSLLRAGQLVGIFPEGTRSKTGKLMEFHTGPIFIALKAGVPVISVGLVGTPGFLGKITVTIGKPMTFTDYYGRKVSRNEMEYLSSLLAAEVKRLIASGAA